jgi:hypothetical protein
MNRLPILAAVILAATPLHAGTPYDTAIWSAANKYCGLVDSGMTREQAMILATDNSQRLWSEYIRNDPQRFYARVRAKINEECAQEAIPTGKEAESFCPGLSVAQMTQIANGQRVLVNWPGCRMEFN